MMERVRSSRLLVVALGMVFVFVSVVAQEHRAGAESAEAAQSAKSAESVESAESAAGADRAEATTNPLDERFDHVGTRFILTGSHEGVACESCHARGVFRGTPTECGFCHDGSGMRAESGKPLDHVASSNQCDDCHTTFTWLEVRFEHAAVIGTCTSCHNGIQSEGKPPGHVVTTSECDTCHSTFSWHSIRFDHAGITQPCSFCHNGTDATGKPLTGHVTTTSECDVCHSTRAWVPATFDHSDITSGCSTCHDGVEATGTPDGHFMSAQDCDLCHTTIAWRPDTFRHMSANYPGDHAQDLDCTECHPGNSDPVVYTDDPSLAPDCAGCHRNDFERDAHKQHENPDHDYTVEELANCAGSCHVYTDSSLTVIKEMRNSEHRVSDRDFD